MLRLDSITPLGKPVVPDVYCMLITSSTPMPAARASSSASETRRGERAELGVGHEAGRQVVVAPMKMRRCERRDLPRGRADGGELVDVVHVAKAADRDERGRLALPQQVVDVARAQRRVGGDENRADLRERELQDHPFGHVGRPQHDALALLDAERHQAARDRARLPLERGERVPRPLRVDERLVRPGSAAARRESRSPSVRSR